MSDYPRRDALKDQRRRAANIWRAKTTRKLRGEAPTITWVLEGPITTGRFGCYKSICLDPLGEGDYPQYKRIVGVEGALDAGTVTIHWGSDNGTGISLDVPSQEIAGVGNYYELPVPYVIGNGTYGREWFWFTIQSVEDEPRNLSCELILETVPV